MDDVGQFLDVVLPAMSNEIVALENGDAGPPKLLWSHEAPVTLFDAEATATGWALIESIFDHLAEGFSDD